MMEAVVTTPCKHHFHRRLQSVWPKRRQGVYPPDRQSSALSLGVRRFLSVTQGAPCAPPSCPSRQGRQTFTSKEVFVFISRKLALAS